MIEKNILIIDDEQDICDLIQASLEEFVGWKVINAFSGKQGLSIIENSTFDAILLDISMPQMDGLSVYQELKSNPKSSATPVIFITAKVLPSDRKRFTQMGVAGVISKPFNPITLWRDIAKILEWNY